MQMANSIFIFLLLEYESKLLTVKSLYRNLECTKESEASWIVNPTNFVMYFLTAAGKVY